MHNSPLVEQESLPLTDALHEFFGFEHFRSGQEEIVRRAVEGRDTLALMPTGSGKSLCFQLAAMLRPQPTLVLSPLIALMKDQIDHLPAAVARRSCLINSSLDATEVTRRLGEMASGRYSMMYAAPERLRQRNFISALRSVGIGMVVIDEVHCVSMWGHDFRPDYMFIRAAVEALGNPVILGMTATATPVTERDIAESLGRNFEVVRTPVVRPNLRYEVLHISTADERLRAALTTARESAGAGIIYARSREKCERIADVLRRGGVSALHYHAGLSADERKRVQEAFLQGRTRVIVATTAFGMGIDKADIRWILLFDYPGSMEDYVQRIGRAGRDGAPSTCTLLAGTADATSLLRFATSDLPTVEALRAVYKEIRTAAENGIAEVTSEELSRRASLLESVDPRVLVGMLERAALVQRDFDLGRSMTVHLLPAPPDTPTRIDSLLRQYAAGADERARRMIGFAETNRCRHLQVAEHFGETVAVPCGMCDVCAPTSRTPTQPAPVSKELPDDIALCIVTLADTVRFPLGKTGLTKTLKGSVDAPSTAQRNEGYGALAGVPQATIVRWIDLLIESGHLVLYPAPDGAQFSLIRIGKRDELPHIDPPSSVYGKPRQTQSFQSSTVVAPPQLHGADLELFERLRSWRRETATEKGVSAFIVLFDRTLRALVAERPRTKRQLESIDGFHVAKLEQYGDDIIAIIESSPS